MPDLTIGDYEIDEDSNGNLVIKDKNDTVVFQYDDASSTFQPQVEFDFGSNDITNVGSLNTDDQTINSSLTYGSHDIGAILEAETSGIRVERGTVVIDGVSGASDNSLSTFNSGTATITFSTAFASAPDVVLGINPDNVRSTADYQSLSTTGFEIKARNFQNNTLNSNISWVAVGPE